MEFLCLGPLEVTVDGLRVDLGEPQRRLVFAVLLAHGNSVVSTDHLVAAVWGDDPPASGRKIIQGYVAGLRKTLGDNGVIESVRPGYRLAVTSQDVDAIRMEELAAEGASEIPKDPNRARIVLGEALALWRGTPYQDLSDYDTLRPEIVRLEQVRLTTVENHMAAEILAGNESLVVDELGDLCRRHPLRERLWTLRLLALYRTGRHAEALRTYEVARQYLAKEVGLEPSAELQLMRDRVLQQDPTLATRSALETDVVATEPTRNPYKGLRAFEEADAEDFFGRDSLVRRLRRVLTRRGRLRLVIVTGASGSGKSSVVRAGLIPQLREAGWNIATMYPGVDPIGAFASASAVSQESSATSIVVVDQLEELFTLVDDRSVRTRFLDIVIDKVDPAGRGPWVLGTIRADFLEELMGHRAFSGLLDQSLIVVTPLDEHEVRDVVTKPASRVGTVVDPSLVAAVIHDVGDRPSALPLLQFTMTDLFDRASGGPLTLEAYRAAGGIAGALIERAEGLYRGFDRDDQEATRQLFLRLVALGEGNDPTRRRVRISSLDRIVHLGSVLEELVEHRLLTVDRHDTDESTVEVAHEALLSEWPRVRSWIEDATAGLRAHARLAEATADWEGSDRSDDYLVTGARLTRFTDWDKTVIALTEAERQFLDASTAQEAALGARRRARRRAVMAGFAAAAVIAGVLAIVAFLSAQVADERARDARADSLAASAIARIDDDPELAVLLSIEGLELSRDSVAAASALDAALQAHRTIYTVDRSATPPALGSISPNGELIAVVSGYETVEVFSVGGDEPLWRQTVGDDLGFSGASFTVDGQLLIVEFSQAGDLPKFSTVAWTLYDATTGEVQHRLDVGEPCLVEPWSMGGANTSTGFVDTALPLFLARYGVSPSGQCDVGDGAAELATIDLWTGQVTVLSAFETDLVGIPTVARDGSRFAFASGGPGGVLEVGRMEPVQELMPGMSTISADGSFALVANKPLRLIHVDSGELLAAYPGEYSRAFFGESGRFIIASSFDGSSRVFDTRDGRVLYELRGAGSRDLTVQSNTDERLAATFAGDGTARVWDIGTQLIGTASSTTYSSGDPDAFLPRASMIAVPPFAIVPIGLNGSRETAIFELDTWNRVRTLPGRVVAVSPDGSQLVMQSWPGPVDLEADDGETVSYNQVAGLVLVDVNSGEILREFNDGPCRWYNRYDAELPGPDCGDYPDPWIEWATSGSFSADGNLFAMGGSSGYAAAWDVDSGELVHFFDTVPGANQFGNSTEVSVSFSPTSSDLAVHQWVLGTTGVIRRVDTTTWTVNAEVPQELGQTVTAMTYTPDGTKLVAVDSASDVVVVDAETWEVETRLEGQQGGQLHDVAVSPDSRLVAVAANDGSLWVWELDSERVFRRIEFQATAVPEGLDGLINVEFIDQDTLLVSSELSAALMTLDPDVLLDVARTRVTRTFTPQECTTYRIETCA